MKSFTLPTEFIAPTMIEPLNLGIYGPYGVGKTPICCTLPNVGYVDCQQGTIYYRGDCANVVQLAADYEAAPWEIFEEAVRQYKARKVSFLVIDTMGELEEYADQKAVAEYRSTSQGSTFQGSSILELPGPKGSAGWGRLWDAFQSLLDQAKGCWHRAIFIAHPRDKIAFATGNDPNVKQDEKVEAGDLDLTGKMRKKFCSQMSAIGFMSRGWDDVVRLSFETDPNSAIKARCPHLVGRKLPFSNPCTLAEWARIYPQTLKEHLLPQDREALKHLLSQLNGDSC